MSAARRQVDAELLRTIAREESLERTGAVLGLSRAEIAGALERLAEALVPAAKSTEAAPPVRVSAGPAGAGARRMRVYSDGAARGNPGPSGAGAVLVDPASGEIVERLGKFLGIQTNNHAEYSALLLGLERARALGVSEVEVYADSELMIRQLEGRYQVKSPTLRPLFDRARVLLKGFTRVKLVHVPREENRDADEMSNRAIDERMA